jgi:hypothetical protein
VPFLISEQDLPAYTELEFMDKYFIGRFVGGAAPTIEQGAALVRTLLKADDAERRRLVLLHYMLRSFNCARRFEKKAVCVKLADDSSLDHLLEVAATYVHDQGSEQVDSALFSSMADFAGVERFRVWLKKLAPQALKPFDETVQFWATRRRDRSTLHFDRPSPEQIEAALRRDEYPRLSLADVLTFAHDRCNFMADILQKAQDETIDRFTVTRLAVGLATARACSPCSSAIVDLARKAKSDWAALAPTGCSNAGQLSKLFDSERYRQLTGDARFYYLVWLVQQGHYAATNDAIRIFDETDVPSTLLDGLQIELSFALEARARAKGHPLPHPINLVGLNNYRFHIRAWIEKNADLFE